MDSTNHCQRFLLDYCGWLSFTLSVS